METMCAFCHEHKERTEKEQKELITRLNRIEGQVRGIKGMIEKGAYCPDVLMQVTAVTAALNGFNKVLLESHVRSCVVEDIQQGNEDAVTELVCLLQKLMK